MYMYELIKTVDLKHRLLHQYFREELAEPYSGLLFCCFHSLLNNQLDKSECQTSFTSELDVMIGAPLSENYRIARSEPVGLASLDGLEAFLFRNGWKMMMQFLKDNRMSKFITDTKDAPVSGYRYVCSRSELKAPSHAVNQ